MVVIGKRGTRHDPARRRRKIAVNADSASAEDLRHLAA
jgi:hypothetical protein